MGQKWVDNRWKCDGIHLGKGDKHCTPNEAINLMKSDESFDKKWKNDIKESYRLNMQLQGPRDVILVSNLEMSQNM